MLEEREEIELRWVEIEEAVAEEEEEVVVVVEQEREEVADHLAG